MNCKEYLKELGFNTFEHVDDRFNELKEQFIEMAQLKSDFDIEKFTVKKEGNFIAHNFHFLMRQYSLTLGEVRRKIIKKEELERDIERYTEKLKDGNSIVFVYDDGRKTEKYTDLHIKNLINELDLLEIGIVNKLYRIRGFEACRLKLIELNGGEVPTNEQYQKEEPLYWKWFLSKKAINQVKQAKTGILAGVWDNIDLLEEKHLINKNYEVNMLDENGFLDLNKYLPDVVLRKKLGYDYEEKIKELKKLAQKSD